MRFAITSRYRAFAVHLSISALIFSLVISVLILAWYPPPYYQIDGLWYGFRIAAIVDLILGPLITLLVFKPGKEGLKFDLACIGLLQAVALIYGTVTIFQQRPYFVVYGDSEFRTVRWSDIVGEERPERELKALHDMSPGRPPIIAVRPPTNQTEGAEMVVQLLTGKVRDFSVMAKRYEPLSASWPTILESAIKQATLTSAQKQLVKEFCAREHCTAEKIAIFRLGGRFDEQMIVFDHDKGTLMGYLNTSTKSDLAKKSVKSLSL